MRCEVLDDAGRGRPVVYVPGIDASGELLLETAERLRAEFRLIRLRHVFTPGDRSSDRYEAMAASIVRELDRIDVSSTILLAESFGGAVALQCALDHPTRVRALAIVNSFAYFADRARLTSSRVGAQLVPRWAFEFFRPRIAPWSLFGTRREAAALRAFRDLRGTSFDEGYRRRLAMIAGLDLRPRLPEIDQPVALFAGTRDRVLPARRWLSTMHELLPNSTYQEIDGGGHIILPLEGIPWAEHLHALDARA